MCRSTLLLVSALLLRPSAAVAQDIPEASPDAIAAHVEGLRAYLAGNNVGALPHFYRAHELDPTFVVPLLMAAIASGNAATNNGITEMVAVSDSLWAIVRANRDRFSDYYQRRIDIQLMRREEGPSQESVELARAAAEAYPGTKAVYNYGFWAVQDGRAKAALEAFATLDPDREPMKDWISFFTQWCRTAHFAGDFAQEAECGRKGSERFLSNGNFAWYVADAMAAQGLVTQLQAPLEEAMSRPNAGGYYYGNIGLALQAHGHSEVLAREYLDKAVSWYDALSSEEAARPAMRRQRAYWLYADGRLEEAREALEGIVADLGSVWDRGYLGITSGIAGDRAAAMSALDEFLTGEMDLTPPQRHYWAGLLCAALDDRACAAEHFRQTWSGPWDHHEPVLYRMRDDPAVKAFVAPRG